MKWVAYQFKRDGNFRAYPEDVFCMASVPFSWDGVTYTWPAPSLAVPVRKLRVQGSEINTMRGLFPP